MDLSWDILTNLDQLMLETDDSLRKRLLYVSWSDTYHERRIKLASGKTIDDIAAEFGLRRLPRAII